MKCESCGRDGIKLTGKHRDGRWVYRCRDCWDHPIIQLIGMDPAKGPAYTVETVFHGGIPIYSSVVRR